MEAMACNLPVILTKFGALPRIFEEKDGLVFVNETEDIPRKIEQIRAENSIVRTREKVTQYSWENVTQSLVEYFCQLVEERRNEFSSVPYWY
jgi:glycosyltransferase involved in cell wall biosynthesis